MERRRHPQSRWCDKSLHGLTSTNGNGNKNPPIPYNEPRKRRSNPRISLVNSVRTHYPLERRDPGQTVSTSSDINPTTGRHKRCSRHNQRRRTGGDKPGGRRSICNTPQNYDSIGVSSKSYGPYEKDFRTNGPRRIPKTRTNFQRKRVTSISASKTMGSRY